MTTTTNPEVTLTATWKHHGPTPPYKVQAETLDLASGIAERQGYEVLGDASGYAVQENESDVSMAIRPRVQATALEPTALAAQLSRVTGKTWKVAEA